MIFLSSGHFHNSDKLQEECALFGIYGSSEASKLTILGLHALQHRGQEGTGIVSYCQDQFYAHRALGKVGDVFSNSNKTITLPGDSALGHNRYSTSGDSSATNSIQPLFAEINGGGVALAHNGNFTNARSLRNEMVGKGSIFQSYSDTEVLMHLMASAKGTLSERLVSALTILKGAYSLIFLSAESIIGLRDPLGMRPLVLGKLDDAYILASESCALDIMDAEYIRDIDPGEMVVIDKSGLTSYPTLTKAPSRFCIFEYIYFSRPDSVIDGLSVYEARRNIGRALAREFPVEGDLVSPVPDSGTPSAIGYSAESKIPFEYAITRNHYVGRTFIEPTDEIRHFGVKLKHNPNQFFVKGKRVILVDDSIVRGTTSRKIVAMMRQAGAKEVHMRIASPPITHSCFYGIDTPEQDQLLAHTHSQKEIKKYLDVDSLAFLSKKSLYEAMSETDPSGKNKSYCDACFTGNYPIPPTDQEEKTERQLSLLSET